MTTHAASCRVTLHARVTNLFVKVASATLVRSMAALGAVKALAEMKLGAAFDVLAANAAGLLLLSGVLSNLAKRTTAGFYTLLRRDGNQDTGHWFRHVIAPSAGIVTQTITASP